MVGGGGTHYAALHDCNMSLVLIFIDAQSFCRFLCVAFPHVGKGIRARKSFTMDSGRDNRSKADDNAGLDVHSRWILMLGVLGGALLCLAEVEVVAGMAMLQRQECHSHRIDLAALRGSFNETYSEIYDATGKVDIHPIKWTTVDRSTARWAIQPTTQ